VTEGRAATWLVVAALLVSYAYFYQAGGWNQNSRFALVRALVAQRTIQIDDYHKATGDKAFFQGHYYSDKAPGQAFAAAPVVAAARPLLRVSGVDPDSASGVALLSYVATLATASIPLAVAAVMLLFVARKLGAPPGGRHFAALVLGLGTPAWAYATLLIGHCMAGAALMVAFAAALGLADPISPRRQLLRALALGVACGWAGFTEYPAGLAALLVAGFALLVVWPAGTAATARVGAGILVGASGFVVALLAYHDSAFGSPFAHPLQFLDQIPYHSERQFVFPPAATAWDLLFGRARGIFALSPVLLAAPVGFVLAWRARDGDVRKRRLAIGLCVAVTVFYWLLNASFVNPGGGWIYGPRLLSASLPFLCCGLAFAFARASRRVRALLVVLALTGAAITFVVVSTNVQPPEDLRRPVSQRLWPSFKAGHVSQVDFSIQGVNAPPGWKARPGFIGRGAWNLGEVLGLRGLVSLVPLVLVWLGLGAVAVALHLRTRRLRVGGDARGP